MDSIIHLNPEPLFLKFYPKKYVYQSIYSERKKEEVGKGRWMECLFLNLVMYLLIHSNFLLISQNKNYKSLHTKWFQLHLCMCLRLKVIIVGNGIIMPFSSSLFAKCSKLSAVHFTFMIRNYFKKFTFISNFSKYTL